MLAPVIATRRAVPAGSSSPARTSSTVARAASVTVRGTPVATSSVVSVVVM